MPVSSIDNIHPTWSGLASDVAFQVGDVLDRPSIQIWETLFAFEYELYNKQSLLFWFIHRTLRWGALGYRLSHLVDAAQAILC